MRLALALGALLVCSSAGCDRLAAFVGGERRSSPDATTSPDGALVSGSRLRLRFPSGGGRDAVDLLLVVDNSGSMGQVQAQFFSGALVGSLADALRAPSLGTDGSGRPCTPTDHSGCKLPDLRVGVISSDLGVPFASVPGCVDGAGGALQSTPRISGCPAPKQPWIAYSEAQGFNLSAPSSPDPTAQLQSAIECIGSLGINGCGFEQPLEAMRMALKGPGPAVGFVRPDALLAVVLLTDSDDCSAADAALFDPSNVDKLGPYSSYRCFAHGVTCANQSDPWAPGLRTACKPTGSLLHDVRARYATFLRSLKPDGRVLFAAITGDLSPIQVTLSANATPVLASSCAANNVSGEPAIRLDALAEALAPDSRLLSVCGSNKGELSFIGNAVKALQPQTGVCLQRALVGEGGGLLCAQGDTPAKGATCHSSCLDRALCDVVEVISPGTSGAARLPIPRCPAARFTALDSLCNGDCPCWRISSDSARCSTQSPYYLEVLRSDASKPGSFIEVDCRVADPPWLHPALAALPRCLPDPTTKPAP